MPPQRNQASRERGRALLSRINRWMIAGAIGLAGLFSFVAAESTHGKTNSSTTTTTTSLQQPSSTPSASSSGSTSATGSSNTTSSSSGSSSVVSGGS